MSTVRRYYDYIVVGAGFVGAVVAERLASSGQSVLVVDRRNHIAGNAYDYRDEYGILCHKYGPHIFHTNSLRVFKYLSRFTDWKPYQHKVLGFVDNRLVPIPFNLTSIEILFRKSEATELIDTLLAEYTLGSSIPILKMRESVIPRIKFLAEFVYERIFLGYTRKQWGLQPEQLSRSVMARVPVNISYDDRYFQDQIQCMPAQGYTKMFAKILQHENIELQLETDFCSIRRKIDCKKIIYTGAVDEFFGYELGELPYRSLEFEVTSLRQERHQPVAQVNYPGTEPFTRITEMTHLMGETRSHTTIAVEYPIAHIRSKTIPYYPVPREDNNDLHACYIKLARAEARNTLFAGRLGDYRYYNMDQAVGRGLSVFDEISSQVD